MLARLPSLALSGQSLRFAGPDTLAEGWQLLCPGGVYVCLGDGLAHAALDRWHGARLLKGPPCQLCHLCLPQESLPHVPSTYRVSLAMSVPPS